MTASALPALELSRITRRFGDLVALDDVSVTVRPGTVHALLGENGAGKSTLMHVAYGMLQPDDGIVSVAGKVLALRSPLDAIRAGIGMVHQHFTLVPQMTVGENIALGGHGFLRQRDVSSRVNELAQRTGFVMASSALVESLSVGAQQRVEIAKALAHDATTLILDEPTAVLAPAEVDDLLRWLRAFVAQGNAAVVITHKLREALAVADDVTVLRRGHVVHTGPARALTAHDLTVAMVGESSLSDVPRACASESAGAPVFVAQSACIADVDGRTRIRDASFTIRSGELIGIAAVEGAGQHELLRALAGRMPTVSGTLQRPKDVGFVPEDRHRDAVLLDRPLVENVALRGSGQRAGREHWQAAAARTASLMQSFDVRAPGAGVSMRQLSGGNQQKLVLARELPPESGGDSPYGLVVENPTRGLDVRATQDVHRRLRDAAASGAAVVLYSGDLDEVLALATRVFVVFEGVVSEVNADRELVGRAMLGAS